MFALVQQLNTLVVFEAPLTRVFLIRCYLYEGKESTLYINE